MESILQDTVMEAQQSSLHHTFVRLVGELLGLRSRLLERLAAVRSMQVRWHHVMSSIHHGPVILQVASCDPRVSQRRKLEQLRVSVEDILLRLVSNTDPHLSALRQGSTDCCIPITLVVCRSVSQLLLAVRETVTSEIQRAVMLPELAPAPAPHTAASPQCEYCAGLEEVAWRLQNLIACAQQMQDFTEQSKLCHLNYI